MSKRGFRFSLVMIVIAIILAVPDYPGEIIGRYLAFAIALFVAFPCGLLVAALGDHGIVVTIDAMLTGALVLYALCVIALGLSGWRLWKNGNDSAGRLLGAKTALLAALPLIVHLSTNGMTNS